MGPAGRGRKHLAQWATRTPGHLGAALVPWPWPKQHISDTLRPAAALWARRGTRRRVLRTHSSRKTSCHPEGRRGSSTRRTGEEKDSSGINQKSCVPRRRSEIMSPIIISAAPQNYAHAARSLPCCFLHTYTGQAEELATRVLMLPHLPVQAEAELSGVRVAKLQRHIQASSVRMSKLGHRSRSKVHAISGAQTNLPKLQPPTAISTCYPCIALACQCRLIETMPALAY